jgi:hypothetical protein
VLSPRLSNFGVAGVRPGGTGRADGNGVRWPGSVRVLFLVSVQDARIRWCSVAESQERGSEKEPVSVALSRSPALGVVWSRSHLGCLPKLDVAGSNPVCPLHSLS